MKREIKFRAWEKIERKMCQVQILTDQGAFLLGANPGKDEVIVDLRMIVEAPKDGRFVPFQECEIMQYTGLKDKNGREIFEGDIVLAQNAFQEYYDNPPKSYQVIYNDGQFQICDSQGETKQWSDGVHDWHSLENANIIEIIGNIYENPELL